MYCQQCGREVSDNSRYCSNCGAPQIKPPQRPPQPQYSSPNNAVNQVQSPMPHSPAQNNATSFNINSNRNSGLIKGISKATFLKIIATVFLLVVVIVFAFGNIKKGAEKEIIGTWRDYLDSYEMTFRKNGKVIIEEDDQTIEGEYSIDSDNTLEMYFSYQGESVSMEMDYIPLDQVDRFENRNLMDEEAMWWYIEDDTLYFNNIDNMLIKD